MNKTVILVWNSGGKFSIKDVNLLVQHLLQYVEGVKILCLTNTIKEECDLIDMKLIPMNYSWVGWWGKLNLFSPELEQYRPFLYLDLDTAIVGNIDYLFPPKELENEFITLEDFYQKGKLASGIMWIPVNSEKVKKIWETSLKKGSINPKSRMDYFLREITTSLFFQDYTDNIRSFKPSQKNYLTKLSNKISVICFHGSPGIHEVKDVDWVFKYVGETKI